MEHLIERANQIGDKFSACIAEDDFRVDGIGEYATARPRTCGPTEPPPRYMAACPAGDGRGEPRRHTLSLVTDTCAYALCLLDLEKTT